MEWQGPVWVSRLQWQCQCVWNGCASETGLPEEQGDLLEPVEGVVVNERGGEIDVVQDWEYGGVSDGV